LSRGLFGEVEADHEKVPTAIVNHDSNPQPIPAGSGRHRQIRLHVTIEVANGYVVWINPGQKGIPTAKPTHTVPVIDHYARSRIWNHEIQVAVTVQIRGHHMERLTTDYEWSVLLESDTTPRCSVRSEER